MARRDRAPADRHRKARREVRASAIPYTDEAAAQYLARLRVGVYDSKLCPLRLLNSVGLTPPHFLIQCEELSPSAVTARNEAETRLPYLVRLTVREQEITCLTCEGRSNQEIADETGLSLPMVKKHLHAIFRTLEVASRSRLMALMQ